VIGTVVVLNKYHYQKKPLPPEAILVGRPSPLGNPYSHLEHTTARYKVGTRQEAVDAYKPWLAYDADASEAREMIRALARRVANGEDLFLVCCCAPLACHGDIIRHHILRLARQIVRSEAAAAAAETK
jgi:hypothetical protein